MTATSTSIRIAVLLNTLALVGVLVINFLANALPLNGVTTGEISGRYPNLFVPAGYTFSIWGLIYVLLIGFVVYQIRALGSGDVRGKEVIQKTGGWFVISCLANIGWIWSWHHEALGLSLAFMVVLFVALVALYMRLQVSLRLVKPMEKIWVQWPFSIYLGWISVAMIANVAAFLVSIGWQGGSLGEEFWAVVMVSMGGLVGLLLIWFRADYALGATILWALGGIAAKRWEVVSELGSDKVMNAAILMGILILVAAVRRWFLDQR